MCTALRIQGLAVTRTLRLMIVRTTQSQQPGNEDSCAKLPAQTNGQEVDEALMRLWIRIYQTNNPLKVLALGCFSFNLSWHEMWNETTMERYVCLMAFLQINTFLLFEGVIHLQSIMTTFIHHNLLLTLPSAFYITSIPNLYFILLLLLLLIISRPISDAQVHIGVWSCTVAWTAYQWTLKFWLLCF